MKLQMMTCSYRTNYSNAKTGKIDIKNVPLSGPDFWPEIGFSLEGLPGRAWRLEEIESKELGRASPRWNAHH